MAIPTTRLRGGDNRVEPGFLVEIPDAQDKPPAFRLEKTRPDQTGVMLTIIVAPVPIPGLAVASNAVKLTEQQVEEWEIIADMHLPKLSADEFVHRHGSLAIPWVVFSASADPAKVKRALQLGALEYIEKPMDLDSFSQALWRSFGSGQAKGVTETEGHLWSAYPFGVFSAGSVKRK